MAMAKLQPTTGKHEVYYVFRNEKAEGGRILFIVTNIAYMSSQAGKGSVAVR
jgi:hypothetical protein